jgi:hypothetical protein
MGVDEKFDFSPAGLDFRRSGAPERRTPTKTYVVPYHVCTSVLAVVDFQDPTTRCDRLHRHRYLRSEFLDL